ncbi:hypothetical protein C7999DRAFT_43998 [Corynascus novoguineensis]|uniref:C2H2-type domain-containing protein n=1 Tax=Corynascus novoguineensis TaxID=1126955 RepID=A0AAN7CME1_9PEZI|nr:hypothetical protein C7999DRAFT_43998 [Corynascus novoguineensis]
MTPPDCPKPNAHVLHRQPKFCPLGKQWAIEENFNPAGAKEAGSTLYDESAMNNVTIPKAVTGSHHDVSRRAATASSENLGVAKSLGVSPLTPHRPDSWAQARSAAPGRQSFEWETETLLESNVACLDIMISYPCPFRKRNPARFNIRDREECARAPFDSVQSLKQHVLDHHQRKTPRHQCRRCKDHFGTETALEEHLLLPRDRICEVKDGPPVDYEDGMTEEVVRILSRGNPGDYDGGPWTWEVMWLHWCGNTDSQFTDYQPVTELAELEQAFDEGQGALKQDLREKLELLLPKPVDPDYLSFLAGQLELVFETYRVNVLKRSSGRCYPAGSGLTQTQSNEQATPPRRPTRRSRRSTMLQALQRNTHASPLPTGTPSNGKGAKQNNHHLNQQFLLRKSETYLGWKMMEDKERSRPVAVATHIELPTNELDITGSFAANPRDSRDSGISMPCDTCSTEPCRCDETTASNKDGHLTWFSPESFKQRLLRQQLAGA